jgi:prepilin-type processing-associated H-X9-DG protein
MSYKDALNFTNNNAEEANLSDDGGFIKHFLCPSQFSSISEFPLTLQPMLQLGADTNYIIWEIEPVSYIYNEAALGWGEQNRALNYADEFNRKHGDSRQIRQPSKTMFVADGLPGSPNDARFFYITGSGMASLYNMASQPPVTMADAFKGEGNPGDLAGDHESFDTHRHNGKINIGFCDGHVELRNVTMNDLATVFLLAP